MCCNICGKKIDGYGNNPYPIMQSDTDRCCNDCNSTYVIPARLAQRWGKRGPAEVGDKVIIFALKGESNVTDYLFKSGVIESIDDAGQLHGTWGGLAVIPEEDEFIIIGD